MMDELKNMPTSRKRLLALLGVVFIFAFYMLVINKPGGSPAPAPSSNPPAAPAQGSGSASGSDTPSGSGGAGTGQAGSGAGGATTPGGSDLPADPTQNQRPGSGNQQKTPSRFPGTQPVVIVYNPFQTADPNAAP